MKQIFTFLTMMMFAFSMNAQYIYNDFDANQNEEFSGWPNVPVIVANPDASGINTSPNVAQFDSTDWAQWDHVYSNLPGKIDFTTGTTFSVKVYSPITCDVLFKLEDQANGGIFVERLLSITSANQWVQLDFDFTGEASDTYDKIVIFFDFATFNANTFYFDDVEGPNYFTFVPKPLEASDVQDNFEDDGWGTIDAWFFQDPNMDTLQTTTDPEDSGNTVADYNRSGGFEWANAQFVLDHRMDLSVRNEFEIDVYLPSSNDYSGPLTPTAAIKLQNSLLGGNAWTTQTEVKITVDTFDEWVTLVFDFSAIADSVNYDQVVIQMGGEGHWVPGQFYFDNLDLEHIPYITVEAPNGGEEIEQNSSYTIEWDYNYWDGDIDIELIKEGNDPEPLVYNIAASDSTFEWNVLYNQEPGEDYLIIITSVDGFATDTSDTYFTILEVDGVQANFEGDPILIVAGDSVSFTDLSSGNPDTWEWFFEGGTPETYNGQNPPDITYDSAGIFDVSLTVYSGGDQDITIKEDYITVGLSPTADFEASETQILVGEMVDFTNLSIGDGNTYQWSFEGGEPSSSTDDNPSGITYDSIGAFDVILIATNDFGDDTLVMTDYITVGTVDVIDNYDKNIQVYPNPVSSQLKIQLPDNGLYQINFQNINGKYISTLANQSGMIKLNTIGYKPGVYILSIFDDKTSMISIRKIIIQN